MSESVINFKVTFGKQTLLLSQHPSCSVLEIKQLLQEMTGVPCNLQKLFLKGPLKNDLATLEELKVKENTKFLLVGSTANDISNTANIRSLQEEEKKLDFSRDGFTLEQQRIIDRGVPAGAIPGSLSEDLTVPDSIPAIYDHIGTLIRMTVRKDLDEIWLVTSSKTKKIPFASISQVSYIPIIKYPGYVVLTLTLGNSNKFNIYFFPQQFSRSLRTLIMPFYIDGNNIFDLMN
jgi:hypothetical protein